MKTPIAVALCLLSACTTIRGNDEVVRVENFLKVHVGTSSKLDVYDVFGQPHDVLYGESGTSVWWYFQVQVSPHGATFVPLIGLFAGGGNQDKTEATFRFDDDGTLSDIATSREATYENMWAGIGAAIGDYTGDLAARVEAEMSHLGKPFDPKIAAEARGLLRGD